MSSLLTFEAGQARVQRPIFQAWLRDHGVDPNVTYRVDVGAEDMVVHQFDRRPRTVYGVAAIGWAVRSALGRTRPHEGWEFYRNGDDVARVDPYRVPLTTPVPYAAL